MGGYVHIMASQLNGTLYTGVTSDLERRAWEHRERLTPGFTAKYGVQRLVWYREYNDIRDAIDDEKRIKKWRRKWKLELIEAMNPKWVDLYDLLGR
ncbi:MAG: GIY-YIG nuclease family protein [Rhizobiaceae bacterium]|nr:GIY-YIG nuclease family protein [Rhizobiaceae bacterium]